jgi:hypothetical protein
MRPSKCIRTRLAFPTAGKCKLPLQDVSQGCGDTALFYGVCLGNILSAMITSPVADLVTLRNWLLVYLGENLKCVRVR